MKNLKYLCLILAIVSCQKQYAPLLEHPFSYNGNSYKTLEEAVNAVKAGAEDGDASVITLLSNASGEGADMGITKAFDVVLDLQSYEFKLNQYASIDAGISSLEIRGNGGIIKACGTIPAVTCDGGSITFSGSASIEGDYIIRSDSDVKTDKHYSGTMKGNISLNDARFYLFSSECKLKIPVLTLTGEKSVFTAETTVSEQHSAAATIEKVISDHSYPVTSFHEGIISCEDGVHIHNFTKLYVSGSCVNLDAEELYCGECGYSTPNPDFIGKYSACVDSSLIHYPASEAGEVEFGNIEYWECPHCKKCYSDSEGRNDVSGRTLLLPSAFDVMQQIQNISANVENDPDLAAGPFDAIGMLIDGFDLLTSLLIPSVDDWDKINRELDNLSVKLEAISNQIYFILSEIKFMGTKDIIMSRQDMLVLMREHTNSTFRNLEKIRKKYPRDTAIFTKEQKLQIQKEFKDVITDWGEHKLGNEYVNNILVVRPNPPFVVQTLIDKFLNVDGSAGQQAQPYPEIFTAFIDRYAIWEHQGSPLTRAELKREIITMSKSFALYNLYYRNCVPESSRPITFEGYRSKMHSCVDLYKKTDSLSLRSDSLYRVLNFARTVGKASERKKITYDRTIHGPHDIYGWLDDANNRNTYRFHRDNEGGKAVNSCKALMSAVNLEPDSLMSWAEITILDQLYNRGLLDGKSMLRILTENCGFKIKNGTIPTNAWLIPKASEQGLTKRDNGLSYMDNNIALPVYKNIHWKSIRLAGATDYFGIFAVGSNGYYTYKNEYKMVKILDKIVIPTWFSDKGQIQIDERAVRDKTPFFSVVRTKN